MSILHKITHNCKDAQMLILQEEHGVPLSLKTSLKQWLHILFCRCCNRFVGQNKLINNLMANLDQAEPQQKMKESKKAEIQNMIDNQL
jgi:hypothetical protein